MSILLHDNLLIGEGATRRCYQHPNNESLCIKIDNGKELVKPTYRESLYYAKLSKRWRKVPYDVIPAFHGFEETNLGLGGVFELCRNEDDGQVAITLSEFIDRPMNASERALLQRAINEFCEKLLKSWIVSTDLKSHNICVVRLLNGEIRLVCIDGMGSKEAIPLCDIWPWWARQKMRRHFKRYYLDNVDELIQFAAGLKPGIPDRRRESTEL